MKKCTLKALLFLALALSVPAAYAAVPDDTVRMEKSKKPVVFDHSAHRHSANWKGMKCRDCHHVVERGRTDYSKCSTAGCHDSMDRRDKSETGYYHMIHARSGAERATCLSCHLKAAEKFQERNKRKELIGCKESKCHQ
jgi:hypothetical protein